MHYNKSSAIKNKITEELITDVWRQNNWLSGHEPKNAGLGSVMISSSFQLTHVYVMYKCADEQSAKRNTIHQTTVTETKFEAQE